VGGNLGKAAQDNGWAGVLVYGAVRDAAELRACQVGIRALALMPCPPTAATRACAMPVQIEGVWVRPGDWLYADEDGIVVMAQPA
jgi:regulator of ribonuclease activity A